MDIINKSQKPVKATPIVNPAIKSETEPVYTVKLPSLGRLYGGIKEVEVTLFTLNDVKRLIEISKGTKSDSLEKLVSSKLINFSSSLSRSDYFFILYWLRVNSFKNYPIKVDYQCIKCEKVNTDQPVSGSNIDTKDIDPDYCEPVELDLPNAGKVQVRLLNLNDEKEISSVLSIIHKDKVTPGDEWLCTLAAMIVNNQPLFSRYEKVRKDFTSEDILTLDMFQDEFNYGVKNALKMTCPGCQEVNQVNFRLSMSVLVPSMGYGGSVRSRVRFSTVSTSTV